MAIKKRGISLMVSYALLIVIAVALAAIVYPFLKLYLPSERVECPADMALGIEYAACNRAETSTVSVQLLNRGLFNVTGAFIRFGETDKMVRHQLNEGKEVYLKGLVRSPLGPGERTPINNYVIDFADYGDGEEFVVEVQPAIYSKGILVPCPESISKQVITCTSVSVGYGFDETRAQQGCDGNWDSSPQDCSALYDDSWSTFGTAAPNDRAIYYVNYTRNPSARESSYWTIKVGEGPAQNLTITPCWANDPLQFKVEITRDGSVPTQGTRFSCLDSNQNWLELHYAAVGSPPELANVQVYDEGMAWHLFS